MNTPKVSLDKAAILIVDEDSMISEVLRQALSRMGLTNVMRAKTAAEALEIIKKKPIDILITEWQMKPVSGLELVKSIRQMEETHLALMPVIMLTARAEKKDVVEARDAGSTEFLVKPFTAKTLYHRLECVIDFPRDFIVAAEFTGHDRRRRKQEGDQTEEEKRKLLPALIADPKKLKRVDEKQHPYRIMPTHELKKRMGIASNLNKIITPEVLEEAQAQIASFQEESLQWIAEDLQRLEHAIQNMKFGDFMVAIEDAKDALLSLKSRAGTFDFLLASEVSFSFYCFLRNKYSFDNPQHALIVNTHLEVLKIIMARKVKGTGNKVEQELIDGLSLLTQKLQDVTVA